MYKTAVYSHIIGNMQKVTYEGLRERTEYVPQLWTENKASDMAEYIQGAPIKKQSPRKSSLSPEL